FARGDRPLAPRRDDLQLRRQRLIGQLESDLIVPFARAAVSQRIATRSQSDLNLLAGDQRPRARRAEEIVALVNRTGLQDREEICAGELFFRIDEIEVACSGA